MEQKLKGNGIRINGCDYEIMGVTGGDTYSDGGPSVFDVFDSQAYQYLEIERGNVAGNIISAIHDAMGIFKLRSGVIRTQNAENSEQGATLHMRPTESFLSGVPANREHYRLTLNPTDFSDYEEQSS